MMLLDSILINQRNEQSMETSLSVFFNTVLHLRALSIFCL